jgi:hypothetical protein
VVNDFFYRLMTGWSTAAGEAGVAKAEKYDIEVQHDEH